MSAQAGSVRQSDFGSKKIYMLWILILPFFMPAALHLSAVFKLFSVLPIIFVHFRLGRVAGIIASVTNLVIVAHFLGAFEAAFFFVFAVVFGAAFTESVKLKLKLEWVTLICVGIMLLASAILLTSYARKFGKSPVEMTKTWVGTEVDGFIKSAQKYKDTSNVTNQDIEKMITDPEETKRSFLYALPSFLLIGLFLVVIGNILLAIKLNIQNVRERLGLSLEWFRLWKAPDHMIWPTIAVGFCLIVEVPVLNFIALNLFRVLMTIYAIQGLAIISSLFFNWKLKNTFRGLGYVLSVAFLLPLVISLGFFDLWFNFREKFGVAK